MTDSFWYGEVVPIPTFPPLVANYAAPVEPIWVVEALPRVVRPVTLSVEAKVAAPVWAEVPPILIVLAKRFVEEAVVAKKLVVVAEVPVAFTKVKFWRVVDPERRRLESEVRPPVAVRVPVKFAAEEMV